MWSEESKKREENEKEQDRKITDNKMGVDGAKAIGKVLKVNTTLRELSMHSEEEGMKINRKLMMPPDNAREWAWGRRSQNIE